MAGFSARLNALEGGYFHSEERSVTQKHLQKLVAEGKLPQSALTAIEEAAITASNYHQGKIHSVPTTVINSRPASEVIFKYDGVAGTALCSLSGLFASGELLRVRRNMVLKSLCRACFLSKSANFVWNVLVTREQYKECTVSRQTDLKAYMYNCQQTMRRNLVRNCLDCAS